MTIKPGSPKLVNIPSVISIFPIVSGFLVLAEHKKNVDTYNFTICYNRKLIMTQLVCILPSGLSCSNCRNEHIMFNVSFSLNRMTVLMHKVTVKQSRNTIPNILDAVTLFSSVRIKFAAIVAT